MKYFTVRPAKIPAWRYEIIGNNFHNIAPSEEAAVEYLRDRFGRSCRIRIIKEAQTNETRRSH